jgi:four helix bundle protein
VGVRRFEDLVAWQLAVELRDRVFAITATDPAARDSGFCNQIQRSTRSVPANIAEGFGRYYPREFVRFLRIAVASLQETKNHLHEAQMRGYIDAERHEELVRLCLRTVRATNRLIAYLLTAKAPTPRS